MNTPGGSGNGNNPSTSNGTSAVPFEQQQRERMASMRAAQQQQQQQQQVQQQQVQQVQQTNLESSFGPAPLRNDLIEKAIGFLTHPKVQDTPLSRKRDFLREKKGMTNAEIEEAIRRSGVTDAPMQPMPMQPYPQQPFTRPPPEPEGFGWATIFAGVVAVASLSVAAYYAYNNWANASSAKEKKKGGKKGSATPAKTPGGGKKKSSAPPPKDKEEEADDQAKRSIEQAIGAAVVTEDKLAAELERLMGLIEENNRQKFELLRSGSAAADDGLRNDVQTIKQLLLTRQQIGAPSTPLPAVVAAAAASSSSPFVAPSTPIVSSTPLQEVLSTSPEAVAVTPSSAVVPVTPSIDAATSSPAVAAKPWEVRRRNRLGEASAATPLATSSPAASTATMEPVPNPINPSSSDGQQVE